MARQSQAQSWNRSGGNFCKPRAQWPDGNLDQPLRFCAPEIFCLTQGVTPVMGVQGVGGMEAGAATPFLPIAPTPWRLFGSFLPVQKGTRRRGGEIPPAYNEPNPKSVPSSAPFGGTFPYPLCRFATSPLDKGSRPPGGRLMRAGVETFPVNK